MRRPPRPARALCTLGDERGAALAGVLIALVVVALAGVSAWTMAEGRLVAARRAQELERAQWLGRGALRVAAGWFEEGSRPGLQAPPEEAAFARAQRRVDVDGDGRGTPWESAPEPFDTLYKPGRDPLLPPDGTSPELRCLGTAEGPDLLLDERRESAAAVLAELARLVDPEARARPLRVALFRAPRHLPDALGTLELELLVPSAGASPRRLVLRAELEPLDWGRAERPLVSEGSLSLRGDARWAFGEALVGGNLEADPAALEGFPGGIPWIAPERPLVDDADADGEPDDADGDGHPDLAAWRADPAGVAEPWWRARVGGELLGVAAPPGACAQPWPFPPRAEPPGHFDKARERSGVFVRCAPAELRRVGPGSRWQWLSQRGARGLTPLVEEPGTPARFRLAGDERARSLEEWLAELGPGALLLRSRPGAPALVVELGGERGAIIAPGRELVLRAGPLAPAEGLAPGDPRDAGGRPEGTRAGDPFFPLSARGDGLFDVGERRHGVAGRASRHELGPDALSFEGVIAGEVLRAESGLRLRGALHGASIILEGDLRATRVLAAPSRDDERVGPPGAPRVVLSGLRVVEPG